DLSYGAYLYAWPTEKVLLWLLPAISAWLLSVETAAIASAIAVGSWYLVERPSLNLKKVFLKTPNPRHPVPIDGLLATPVLQVSTVRKGPGLRRCTRGPRRAGRSEPRFPVQPPGNRGHPLRCRHLTAVRTAASAGSGLDEAGAWRGISDMTNAAASIAGMIGRWLRFPGTRRRGATTMSRCCNSTRTGPPTMAEAP